MELIQTYAHFNDAIELIEVARTIKAAAEQSKGGKMPFKTLYSIDLGGEVPMLICYAYFSEDKIVPAANYKALVKHSPKDKAQEWVDILVSLNGEHRGYKFGLLNDDFMRDTTSVELDYDYV